MLKNLNTKQIEAVTTIDGPILIIAGPGSGKTRVLTHRVAYLIQQGIPAENILAVTFTNKAAGEMKTRIEKLVGHISFLPFIGTFHSFCLKILRKNGSLFLRRFFSSPPSILTTFISLSIAFCS